MGLREYAAQQAAEYVIDAANPALAKGQEEQRTAESRAAEVYRRWQENTIKTEALQRQILQGVKGNTSYKDLLLLAVEALQMTINNPNLLTQVRQGIAARETE